MLEKAFKTKPSHHIPLLDQAPPRHIPLRYSSGTSQIRKVIRQNESYLVIIYKKEIIEMREDENEIS